MIFDELRLPKEVGASDLQDSSRLAGIMETFRHPEFTPLRKYVIRENDKIKYCRHPKERRYNFSRDQTLCLVAGLYFQDLSYLVNLSFVDGYDIFTPAHRGHIRRCQGKKAYWYQDLWFWFDVWRAAKFDKLGEPNQLLCQMMVADKKYLKYWTKHNEKWKQSIEDYWCGWRQESELAIIIINKVKESINNEQ